MPTSKVRKATPMRNKMAYWRRMAKKQPDGTRTGRRLKNMMSGVNHPGMMLPIHVWLFRSANIQTPVLDKAMADRYNINNEVENDASISDAVIINEGTSDASQPANP